MRALGIILATVVIAACTGGTQGGDDWVKIPTDGPHRAASLPEAQRRADAWCRQHGLAGATFDDDGDGRFYRFTCKP